MKSFKSSVYFLLSNNHQLILHDVRSVIIRPRTPGVLPMQLHHLPDTIERSHPLGMLPLHLMPKTIGICLWVLSILSHRGLPVQPAAGGQGQTAGVYSSHRQRQYHALLLLSKVWGAALPKLTPARWNFQRLCGGQGWVCGRSGVEGRDPYLDKECCRSHSRWSKAIRTGPTSSMMGELHQRGRVWTCYVWEEDGDICNYCNPESRKKIFFQDGVMPWAR